MRSWTEEGRFYNIELSEEPKGIFRYFLYIKRNGRAVFGCGVKKTSTKSLEEETDICHLEYLEERKHLMSIEKRKNV